MNKHALIAAVTAVLIVELGRWLVPPAQAAAPVEVVCRIQGPIVVQIDTASQPIRIMEVGR